MSKNEDQANEISPTQNFLGKQSTSQKKNYVLIDNNTVDTFTFVTLMQLTIDTIFIFVISQFHKKDFVLL